MSIDQDLYSAEMRWRCFTCHGPADVQTFDATWGEPTSRLPELGQVVPGRALCLPCLGLGARKVRPPAHLATSGLESETRWVGTPIGAGLHCCLCPAPASEVVALHRKAPECCLCSGHSAELKANLAALGCGYMLGVPVSHKPIVAGEDKAEGET